MSDESPLVSVIVPTMNQADYIDECIRSILAQNYSPIEIIVIDGGSTDGTIGILSGYGDRIRWISEPDSGIDEALNKGFDLSNGEIIGWLNSDDVYFRVDGVRRAIAAFREDPRVDVIYGDIAIISRDGILLRLRLLSPFRAARLKRSNVIAQPAVFMQRRVIEKARPRAYISLDYEYWLRLVETGFKFRHVPHVLAGDRQYPERLSVRSWDQIEREMQEYNPGRRSTGLKKVNYLLDRCYQALFRLKGAYILLQYLLIPGLRAQLSFEAKFDHPVKLLYRQLFRSITAVE